MLKRKRRAVVAHLLLVQLVDVALHLMPLEGGRHLGDPGEELVVLVLQAPDVFLELVELIVLFDHDCH